MHESSPSFHVAGVLVQALPASVPAVRQRIARLTGATVHAGDEGGKLVVTLESTDPADIVEGVTQLQRMRGVVSAVMVTEHSELLSAADEVLTNDASPQEPA